MSDSSVEDNVHIGHLFGAIFLVAGTCIGGGMLALPLMTGLAGFIPSSVMLIVCWVFMTSTGLLFLEANIWLGSGKHIITMAQELLGSAGKWVTLVLYLYICYASLVAYVSVGSDLLLEVSFTGAITLNKTGACILFGLFFGVFIYLGTNTVGRINSLLIAGMVISYFGIVMLGTKEVSTHNLTLSRWGSSILAIPILLTSFSFQTMMPSLTPYLKGNVKYLRWAIILGTAIPLVAYLIWDWLILGIVPLEGEHGLRSAMQAALPVTRPLQYVVNNPWVYYLAGFFSFFALVTSFLGISLGLYDFLADGLKVAKRGMNKLWLTFVVFVPTIIFAIFVPNIFLAALDSTGGYGDAILNGIIPALMVWRGRYLFKKEGEQRLAGGKPTLLIIIIFSIFVVVLETVMRFK